MKTTTMLAALAALGLAACQPDRQPETAVGELTEAARTDEGYRTDDPASPVRVPDATLGGDRTMTGQLVPAPGSGVSGDFTITPGATGTVVSVRLSGVRPETGVQLAIHQGRCAAPGAPVRGSQRAFRVDASGIFTESWEVPVRIEQVQDGNHVLMVQPEHAGTAPGAAPPLACVDLPAATGRR
jgi:hypothetical protein